MNRTANDFLNAQSAIRDAREDDAEFLAQVILSAAHLSDMDVSEDLTAICRRTDTLYSWRNARITCACGKRA